MANRNRVIYQSKAVYAGPDKSSANAWEQETGDNDPIQLKRVQSANYGFDIARTDVNQFGELAAIDRVILESPTVNFDTSWYLCNFYNEDKIGLRVNTDKTKANLSGVLADILENYAGERNYYVRVVKDGSDAINVATGSTDNAVIAVGNGFLSSWGCEASVGGFPTANVTVEGLNIAFTSNSTGYSPYVDAAAGTKNATHQFHLSGAATDGESDSTLKVVKPGNITLDLPDDQGGAKISDIKIQSFNCSVDLSREPLQKLGSRFAFAREITFPINATMSVDALAGDIATGNLADIIDNNSDQELIVHMKDNDGGAHMAVVMKKAKLDSQSFSQGIGDNETVSLNWSAQVGSASQTDVGLFLSGDSTDGAS